MRLGVIRTYTIVAEICLNEHPAVFNLKNLVMKKKEYNPTEDYNKDTGLHPAITGDVLVRTTRVILAQHISSNARICYKDNYAYYMQLIKEGKSKLSLAGIENKLLELGSLAAHSAREYEATKKDEVKDDIASLLPSLN